jgi:hypothetical protein
MGMTLVLLRGSAFRGGAPLRLVEMPRSVLLAAPPDGSVCCSAGSGKEGMGGAYRIRGGARLERRVRCADCLAVGVCQTV